MLGPVEIGGDVSAVWTLGVGPDFFQAVGYEPTPGRGFAPAEYTQSRPTVAVISHAMWRTRFGGAADVLERTMRLNGEPVTIVGVLPESFDFPYEDEPVEVIVPLRLTVDPADVAEDWPAIARLRKGLTRQQAQSDVASLLGPFRAAYPNQVSEQDRGMTLATFSELYVDDRVRYALWILMGAVSLVLLIGCANVANLFLARAARRRGEIALRAALGATRARIIRLVLAESALVALAAGALGLLLGRWVASVLVALTPTEVPRMAAVGIDWRVLVFTFAAALATSLLFGGAAAWPASRARHSDVLKETSRGSSGRRRVRQGLLVAQSALSMVLLVGAGLLVVTMIGLMRSDPGFEIDGLVAVQLPTKPAGYRSSQDLWRFEQRVIERLEGSPVISSIAGASSLPLERGINTPMSISGRPDVDRYCRVARRDAGLFPDPRHPGADGPNVRGYRRGEWPACRDRQRRRSRAGTFLVRVRSAGAYRSVVSRAALAGVEIVGIVADIREISLRAEPRRTIYMPQAQAPAFLSSIQRTMPVFIAARRVAGDAVERALREALRDADPALPKPQVFPLDDVVARSLARERFGATLVSVLAALALGLTAFGIYGVLAYTVQQRRREIGIRMALGADGRHVTRMVMVQGIAPVLAGTLLGVVCSLGLSRIVAGFLWGVTPTDPRTFATVAATLLGVALVASWIPAREAARLDPLTWLKCE